MGSHRVVMADQNTSKPSSAAAEPVRGRIVTINGGSSSIKFAVFGAGGPETDSPSRLLSGQIERIGTDGAQLVINSTGGGGAPERRAVPAADHAQAADQLIDWLLHRMGRDAITAIGHRVVHGGVHLLEHQLVTPDLIAELHRNEPLDLAHLPREIALLEAFARRIPGVPQVACFDTAFHRDLPRVAQLLPIPRRYSEAGVRKFGFHGLSYTYLMDELRRTAGDAAADGRVILAHLGSGASMAAVHRGRPIDTTMAFTPLAGLVMGTRPGDLDPGLLVYLMRAEGLSPEQMDDFLSRRCGMIGVSETSADMRDLVARSPSDVRAREAVELFCYSARKWVGALAATMGGLDTLVFAGGIGEHGAEARAGICEGLEFLGVRLDAGKNRAGRGVISAEDSRVEVRIIPTDEEVVIARILQTVLRDRISAGGP
jgi:acetate kinase